ncbi:nitroreductase family protein [Aequorivita marina]|uniref:nitroreductase family protein n=1 Tax=Aequorivita marina TaxID=3073654 RepID=UPI002875E01B|nr:nitroreductase [Aequorivita sp. S2608]MDS1299747.1 nitroreductase [Aequorivita sp. S2608]
MILKTIKNRRAVFPAQYNDTPITKAEILSILEAANWAPTHKRTEPWRFKVFHGDSLVELGKFMGETYKNTTAKFSDTKHKKLIDKCAIAKCVIAICMQRDPKERVPEWEEVAATAMAVQNMWLTASEMKIGAYWSSPALIKQMGEFLNLEEGEHCLGFFYMGKYDDALPAGTRNTSIEEKTEWM